MFLTRAGIKMQRVAVVAVMLPCAAAFVHPALPALRISSVRAIQPISTMPGVVLPTLSRSRMSTPPVMLSSGSLPEKKVDVPLIAKWIGATALQLGLILLFMGGVDSIAPKAGQMIHGLTSGNVLGKVDVAKIYAVLFFAFMSIRSRVFSPLDNSRPTPPKKTHVSSGMPPPKAFPIIWSTIGLLRTISSVIVWEAMGRTFLSAPIMAMMLHLSIGDTWNTINNVERRKGSAAAAVCFVLASVWNVIHAYYQTSTKAGMILFPSGIWLSVATALIWTIWKLNGKESLLPYKEA